MTGRWLLEGLLLDDGLTGGILLAGSRFGDDGPLGARLAVDTIDEASAIVGNDSGFGRKDVSPAGEHQAEVDGSNRALKQMRRMWLASSATPSKLGCKPSAANTRAEGSHSNP